MPTPSAPNYIRTTNRVSKSRLTPGAIYAVLRYDETHCPIIRNDLGYEETMVSVEWDAAEAPAPSAEPPVTASVTLNETDFLVLRRLIGAVLASSKYGSDSSLAEAKLYAGILSERTAVSPEQVSA